MLFIPFSCKPTANEFSGLSIPEDIREVGRAILRHRILLTYEAEAEEITTEDIITQIFESIPTP